jgi:hypothetical protein
VRLPLPAECIKLPLEQCIDSGVEIEWEAGRPRKAEPLVEVEAPRAIVEKLEAAAGDLVGLRGLWIEEVTATRHG